MTIFNTADRQQRRAARVEQDRLRAELAEFRTGAERDEIMAILDRHDDETEAAPLRALVG